MKTVKTHHDLEVWKTSMELAIDLYSLTEKFPSHEKFGLISQIRRAGVSIPANIAEGAARNSAKDFRYYITVALGSAAEIETQLEIAFRLGYLERKDNELQLLSQIRKMLVGLRKSIELKMQPPLQ
jgi:four helix bundle protein